METVMENKRKTGGLTESGKDAGRQAVRERQK